MISLAGKIISVTGCASGIGLATAKALFAQGASLSLTDINKDTLSSAVETIRKTSSPAASTTANAPPGEILATVTDIRQSSHVNEWIDKTVSHFGRLDGSANIAGVLGKNFGLHDLTQLSDEEFEWITSCNFKGTFNCMRAQLKAMSEGGVVVNAASTTGLEGHPKNSVYSATKHAVIGLSKSAAGEVGDRKIRVNCVAPGIFNTPMVAGLGGVEHAGLEVFKRVALSRIGQPEECANVFAFLLSDEAKFITGSVYTVDGGMLA